MKRHLTKTAGVTLLKDGAAGPNGCISGSAEFMTPDDWAAKLKVAKRTIFRMKDEGIIPPYDFAVGKTKRWHVSTYERWVTNHMNRN